MNSPHALTQRGLLAAHIGIITVTWSEIERFLGMMLADMLGSDKSLGIAIYLSLQSEGPQRAVLKSVAKSKLPEPLAEKVITHLEAVRHGSSGRNKVVHGIWGIADELPDALIRIESKRYLARYGEPFTLVDDIAVVGPDMEVWRQGDFLPIRDNLIDLAVRSIRLNREILNHLYGSPPERA